MRNGIAIVAALLFSTLTMAQGKIDTIYTKDGSVIKGTIVAHDAKSELFSIQINESSTIDIQQSDILRMEQRNFPIKRPTVTEKRHPLGSLLKSKPLIHNTISLGNLWHSVTYPGRNELELEDVHRYQGLKLTYQKSLSRFLASRNALEYASSQDIEIKDSSDDIIKSDSEFDKSQFTGLSSTITLNLNLKRGPQLYGGVGLYLHHYQNKIKSDKSYLGTRFELGGGYMWDTIFLLLQYQWQGSEMYPSEVKSIFSGGLEFGMVF